MVREGGWVGDEGEYRHRRETERQRGMRDTHEHQ
jgi:hypothetical protein